MSEEKKSTGFRQLACQLRKTVIQTRTVPPLECGMSDEPKEAVLTLALVIIGELWLLAVCIHSITPGWMP